MDLINCEPECPGGTFPAGYMIDGWHNWRVVCLVGLSIEDIEDIYPFGTMITGLLLFRAGLALAYRRLEKKVMAVQDPTRLSAMMETMGRAVTSQTLFMQRNTDKISENLTDVVNTQIMLFERKFDNILEELMALQWEIERPVMDV